MPISCLTHTFVSAKSIAQAELERKNIELVSWKIASDRIKGEIAQLEKNLIMANEMQIHAQKEYDAAKKIFDETPTRAEELASLGMEDPRNKHKRR